MRLLLILLPTLLASACGGMEYRDTNAAVDENPLCVTRPDQPNEPVAKDCERKAEASWSSESKPDPDAAPIDFGKKH